LAGHSGVQAENQEYWLDLEDHQQDRASTPINVIEEHALQLFDVIGEGAFGRVLKGRTFVLTGADWLFKLALAN